MTGDALPSVRAAATLAVLLLAFPPLAAAQERNTHLVVQGLYGTHLAEGGDSRSISVGISVGRVDVLVSAERLHLPTEVRRHEHGSSVSRRGTATFISGEIRWAPFPFRRVVPYVLGGWGRGKSRLNVNEFFPDPVTNDTVVTFAGGGFRMPMAWGLSAVADVRVVLQAEDSVDGGGMYLFGPVRGGLAWRF